MMQEITELMQSQLFIQMELLFRIIVAGICGAFIGLERKKSTEKCRIKNTSSGCTDQCIDGCNFEIRIF